MVKVQLPTVEEDTRSKLNQVKARRNDKTLDKTLNYLTDLDERRLDLTYEEVEALYSISSSFDESTDDELQRNCDSASRKLRKFMKIMDENKESEK